METREENYCDSGVLVIQRVTSLVLIVMDKLPIPYGRRGIRTHLVQCVETVLSPISHFGIDRHAVCVRCVALPAVAPATSIDVMPASALQKRQEAVAGQSRTEQSKDPDQTRGGNKLTGKLQWMRRPPEALRLFYNRPKRFWRAEKIRVQGNGHGGMGGKIENR